MYVVIYGFADGDSYLVEQPLGVYNSIKSIPKEYKKSNKYYDYLGIRTELTNEEYDKYSCYGVQSYIRIEKYQINNKFHLLD